MVYSLFNYSIGFLVHETVGFVSEIKYVCQISAEILTIFDFCGGHFEFRQ